MPWRWLRVLTFGIPIVLVGILDEVTGADYGLSIFYLGPVVLAGWREGKRAAVLMAVLASSLWGWAEATSGDAVEALPLAWNTATRLFIFCAMGVGAAVIHADRERLRDLVRREQELARTDAMTGLPNRRAFDELVSTDLARARRDGQMLTLLLLDLDNFKAVNDRHGHAAGDEVLVGVGRALRSALREGDRAARIGGDEFAVLLWNADAHAAMPVADRLVRAIESIGERYPDAKLGVSFGVASAGDLTAGGLFATADEALYRMKSRGKSEVARR